MGRRRTVRNRLALPDALTQLTRSEHVGAGVQSARLDDQVITVVGDLAYELGCERGPATFAGQQVSLDHRVTNIYRREAGHWKIVHHHTDVSPAMLDVLNRLPNK